MMTNQDHIEQIFQALDAGARIYESIDNVTYLDGVCLLCESVLNQEPVPGLDSEKTNRIQQLVATLSNVDYAKEDIRKAMQLAILQGLKSSKLSNEGITPDTIGIFIAYLIQKLMATGTHPILFDPLSGTGNLVATVMNHLDEAMTAVLVDQDPLNCRISRILMAMLDYNDDIYCQDTFSFRHIAADILVTDFPFPETEEDNDFPYRVLSHHYDNLASNAMLLLVVPDGFFAQEYQERFKKELLSSYQAIGLIRLPQELFLRKQKSVLILKKGDIERSEGNPFLIAEIPSFIDQDALRPVLHQINQWFLESTCRKEQ
jgi:site-specific DNA-methyltransferase (adenine-specific)